VVPAVQVALHASHADLPKINFKFFAKTQPSHGMKIEPECSVFPLLHFPGSPFPTVFYLAGGQCQGTFRAADFPAPCQRRDTKLVPRTVPPPPTPIAQTVIRLLLTAEARDRSQVSPCRMCGGQSNTDRGLSEYLVLPVSVIPLCFTFIFVSSEAWEVSRQQCSLVNRAALDRKVLSVLGCLNA